MAPLAMFPLATVLLPRMVLPLHVFEPRYQTMLDELRADPPARFGVVPIHRGPEVGGGEQRAAVGTIAEVVRDEPLPDGRSLLVTLGTQRIAVDRWLPDAPFPRAEVSVRGDLHDDAAVTARWAPLRDDLRRILALTTELGYPGVPATIELTADPAVACWQGPVLAPLLADDRARLLQEDDCAMRLTLLSHLLTGREEALQAELHLGG